MITNFLIEEREVETAQELCANIKDNEIRSRAVANCVAAIIAKKYFAETAQEVDIETGLYNLENILKDFEISDIYVNGNYIDLRLYFDEKEICVPKSHFDNETEPLAYMFIKVSEDIKDATVTGFILPDTITRIKDNNGYYAVNENALSPYEEIEYLLRNHDDLFNVEDEEIFDFIDNKSENKAGFVKKLVLSTDGRLRFKKAIKANNILKNVTLSEEVLQEETELTEGFGDFNFADIMLETTDSANNQTEEAAELNQEKPSFTEQNEDYPFSTVASPKFEETEPEIADLDNLEAEIEASEEQFTEPESENRVQEEETEETEGAEKVEIAEDAEEIDTLFEEKSENSENIDFRPKRKKLSPVLVLLLLAAAIGGAGYFGYTKFAQSMPEETLPAPEPAQEQTSDAMPVETVEKTPVSASSNEGNSVSIPAIEKNLDASILVTNLRVELDVPAGYASNTQARRYLTKLGKIIQLNLKSELLLLSRPPISNKIAVEIKYNKNTKSFEAVDFVTSSGEKTVDDVIMQTIKGALNKNLNINTDSFGKLSGNPIILIKL